MCHAFVRISEVGEISRRVLEAGRQGVLRVLAHEGVITKAAASRVCTHSAADTRFLDLGDKACFVTATSHGLTEPLVGMGTNVIAGQAVVLLRDLHQLYSAPQKLMATTGGVVAIRRTNPPVAPGDHFVVLCPELRKSDLEARLAEEESKISTR